MANSFRGSAALRCAWFDNLARRHEADGWFSEAVVCQLHSLSSKEEIFVILMKKKFWHLNVIIFISIFIIQSS
jgi:hypothetical protein